MISKVLEKDYGQIVIGILGLILAGNAIFQFYLGYSGKFREKLEESGLNSTKKKILLRSGKIGFTARGIVAAIIAYLLLKSAWQANATDAGGKYRLSSFYKTSLVL